MMMRRALCALCAAVLLLPAPGAKAISLYELMAWDLSDSPYLNLSVGTGFEFETGDYGTSQTVDTWRIPLLIEWAPIERLSLSVEIPYVHQSNTSETVLIGGIPVRSGGRRLSGPGLIGGTPSATLVESSTSESGLGDITLDANLTLLNEEGARPRLAALFYAKFPTADEQKGLGTGEFDWGGGLGIGKRFGNWSSYAEALYITPGTSSGFEPDPYWEWLASLSYRLRPGLRPGIALSGGTAPFDGADDPLEVKARISGLAGDHASYSLYVARGLSDGSPDWGVGVIGYLDF